jgi:hypothetical protein
MSGAETSTCTCGCCSGISIQTPVAAANLPGLPAIAYRTGTWATFRESMLARLSSSRYPALAYLKTRSTDDFSIALLDASSVVLDILTFYQERLANESYLRTATQLRSLTELARLINYQPAPGISAETYLAFTIKAATGLPANPGTTAITIPAGTQVQSVPAQNQTPQYFETSADILAKADWNALPVATAIPWTPQINDLSVYLQGTATQLQPGDAILIVGDERTNAATSQNWDVRIVTAVQTDSVNQRTLVTWSDGLGSASKSITPSQQHPKFYAFRQRAALFGYNALNPLMLTPTILTALTSLLDTAGTEWNFAIHDLAGSSLIDLDAVYSKLTKSGWAALILPDGQNSRSPAGLVSLFQIDSISSITRSDFAMSAKISRLATDTLTNLGTYYDNTRSSSALVQSEQIQVAEQPLDHPLYGAILDIDALRPDLVGIQAIAFTGKAQKLSLNPTLTPPSFAPDDDPSSPVPLNPGDIVTLIDPNSVPPLTETNPQWRNYTGSSKIRVTDASGRTGTINASVSAFSLAPSSKSDPVIQEFALVSSVLAIATPYPHTQILLQNPLVNCYDRSMTTVNANVGLATAGRSVSEIMGNGSAATPNQNFTLRQSPLTYVQSPTPTGRLSTLKVQANGVAWKEVPTLYQQPPTASVFETLNQSDATADVLFGDGVEGATLPTGQNNLLATYRVGSGVATNVAPASITTLVDRPLGVSGVINPQAASGGQDSQSIADVRANAPLSVLTLGRAVSITDYQNYAATFAGIAKAYAIWIPSGPARGVFLTVAGAGGVALPAGNPTLANLFTSLQTYGNPHIPITAVSFLETLFQISAEVAYDPSYDATAVQAAIIQSLRTQYSFTNRSFGQGVSGDEVAAFIQAIPGVVAVNVTALTVGATSDAGDLASGSWSVYAYTQWAANPITLNRPSSGSQMRICPWIPIATPIATPQPAEILVLDPAPKGLVLGVMA